MYLDGFRCLFCGQTLCRRPHYKPILSFAVLNAVDDKLVLAVILFLCCWFHASSTTSINTTRNQPWLSWEHYLSLLWSLLRMMTLLRKLLLSDIEITLSRTPLNKGLNMGLNVRPPSSCFFKLLQHHEESLRCLRGVRIFFPLLDRGATKSPLLTLKKSLLTLFFLSARCNHFCVNQFIYTHMNPTFWCCSAPKCTAITPKATWKLRASPQCNCSCYLMVAHSESIYCTTCT